MPSISRAGIFAGLILVSACRTEEPQETLVQANPEPQAIAAPQAKPELGSFGIDLSEQDPSVKPGDDFFRYANGKWLNTFEIPADRGGYGSFQALAKRSNERVQTIIEDLIALEPQADSLEQKISHYYQSYMDTDQLNAKGIEPLLPGLAALNEIDTLEELVAGFGRAQIDNTASPIGFGVGANRADPNRYQLSVSVGGYGLPDRDYYLEDTEEFLNIRQEYVAHIAKMLSFADIPAAEQKAQAILALETQLAERTWPRSERRNRDLTFNPMTYEEFKSAYPGFDWDRFFTAAGVTELTNLNVSYPSAMPGVIELINQLPISDWTSYMTYRFIADSASVLSEEIDGESFNFYSKILSGVPQQQERWERGVSRVGSINSLGEALGQVYVDRYFPESAKQKIDELVANLRNALAESLVSLDWMGEDTKRQAQMKLDGFRPKIAYPDQWKDLSDIKISRDDLFANAQNLREYNYAISLARIDQKTDREEWRMTPQTVNAYYNSTFNEIVFPAGILQPPFFDEAADPAVNYGGIGAVIGHEIGHGFDDQGSKTDYEGVQRNWWSDEDRANFDALTSALDAQFDQYEPIEGYFVDGAFTLGENIGDLGGLSMAYRAYKMSLGGEEAPIIEGLTGDQRFFLAFAQIFKSKYRDDLVIQRLKSDPHSPAEYRVNGIVRNFDEWYEAFDVTPEDDLYLPPEERIRIW